MAVPLRTSSASLSWSDEMADPFELPCPSDDERGPYGSETARGARQYGYAQLSEGGDDQQPSRHDDRPPVVVARSVVKALPDADEAAVAKALPGAEEDEALAATSADALMMSNPAPALADLSDSSDDIELQTLPLKLPAITFAPPVALKAAAVDMEGSISLDASAHHLLMTRFTDAVTLRATEKARSAAIAYDTPSDDTMRGAAIVQISNATSDDSMADSRLNFSVQNLLPKAPPGVEEIEAGHIRKRQRVNPSAYLTIFVALAITAACVLLQLDIFPTSPVFNVAKLALSPFSTIFGALMTYLFNDMHGFHVDYSSADGYFVVKRYTAVTWPCFGAKVREFAARDLRSVKIVHPCGSPDRAALVFETTRGHFAAGRQPRFCRCGVAELEEEARFWVYIASTAGAKCQFSGVQVNKILPPMY